MKKTGLNKSKTKDCMNVINPRLLYLETDPDTLIQHLVPPPELHLLIGVVSHVGSLLMDLWPDFDNWLNQKTSCKGDTKAAVGMGTIRILFSKTLIP